MYSVITNFHDVKFCGYNDEIFTPQKFPVIIWYLTAIIMSYTLTLRINFQGLTLMSHKTTTVHCYTKYCNVVIITCHETSELTLCDTGISDVQKSSIWGLGSISGNVDEVEISTVSTTPAHSDTYSSTDSFNEVNTGKSGDRGRT